VFFPQKYFQPWIARQAKSLPVRMTTVVGSGLTKTLDSTENAFWEKHSSLICRNANDKEKKYFYDTETWSLPMPMIFIQALPPPAAPAPYILTSGLETTGSAKRTGFFTSFHFSFDKSQNFLPPTTYLDHCALTDQKHLKKLHLVTMF